MRRVLLIISLLVASLVLYAQDSSGIGFSSWMKGPYDLDEANQQRLQVKVDQIIARNGAGSTSALSQVFVIYPEFIITRTDEIRTGMKPITVVRGELSLFAVNVADMSNYGTVVVTLEGNGNNEQDAIRAMLNKVQVTSPQFARFIKNAQQNVVDYFVKQTPNLLAKAKSLADRKQYDEALVLLSMIPETVDDYPMIADQMVGVYMKMQDRLAETQIQQAKAKIALKEYKDAFDLLSQVDPSCKKSAEAFRLIQQVKAEMDEREQRAIDAQSEVYEQKREAALRAQDNETEMKKLRVETSKTTANDTMMSQIGGKLMDVGVDVMTSWFLGKLKR